MPRYTVKICPSSISDNSLEYEHGTRIEVTQQDDDSFKVIVPICRVGSYCHSGQITKVKLCPIGETCGCNYETSISWKGYTKDRVLVEWNNPDKCILDRIELKAKTVWGQSWNTIMKYIHIKDSDPNVILYPDDDPRNDEYCQECGIGGEGRHPPGVEAFWDTGKIIPGMMYRVDGYFRNETCGGVEQPVVLGYSLYETPALTSGEITEIIMEDGKRAHPPRYKVKLYWNDIDYYPLTIEYELLSVDYYPWEVGDPVMILKDQKNYPGGEPIDDREDAPGGPAYIRFDSGNTEREALDLIISAYDILEGYYGLV